MECLQCQKELVGKRDTAKYCSDNCRVKWNRKNVTKKDITKVQIQVLYNEILEMVERIKSVPMPNFYDAPPINKHFTDEPPQYLSPKPQIRRSFDYYRQARVECTNDEEWAELKDQILNDDFLSQKQKTLLTN